MAQMLLKYSVTLEQYEAAFELAEVTMYVCNLYKLVYYFIIHRESYRETVAAKRKSSSNSTPASKRAQHDE